MTETESFAAPDAAYCDLVRRQHGMSDITVLYDAGSFSSLGLPNNHVHLVMERGDVIRHRIQYRDDTFRPAIDAILGR